MGTEERAQLDTAGSVAANAAAVRERVAAAAARAGRDPSGIRVVAVSKTKPAAMIAEAHRAGLFEFGENYIQELVEKQQSPELSGLSDIKWHMVGHIQTNKVRKLIGSTALIHSLDSLRLAAEIQRQAERASVRVDVLLEVNVAKESGKYGFFIHEVARAVEEIAVLPNICIRGLMTSAPLTADSEQNRPYFRELSGLYIDIGKKGIHNVDMSVLSMGMSGDFETAVEEGATMLRIGTRLFGSRDTGPRPVGGPAGTNDNIDKRD